jgi:ArsR family transcriptional regulator, virulence genes transcriptional regulator
MENIFELHAEICKVFSNGSRLEILNALRGKEMTASELIERIGLSKANLSQHMAVLKSNRVVLARREGVNIFYRISDSRITQACELMREVLLDQLKETGKVAASFEQTRKQEAI